MAGRIGGTYLTNFGFRLFTFSAYEGHKRKQLDLVKPLGGGKTLRELFVEGLRDLKGTTRPGVLRYPDRATDTDPDDSEASQPAGLNRPCIRIESVVATTERVEVWVRYGREGDFDFAVHTDGRPDTDLKGAATTRLYTVLFYFPTAGGTAVMVAETRARGQVGESVLRLLSVVNCEDAQRAAADGDVPPWTRWTCAFMGDSERLAEVLRTGDEPALKLVRYGANASGTRGSRALTLTQNGVKASERDHLQAVVLGWLRRDGSSGSFLDKLIMMSVSAGQR